MGDSDETVVTDSGLIYHDPAKLESTRGMTELSRQNADERGMSVCSMCFPDEVNCIPIEMAGPVA